MSVNTDGIALGLNVLVEIYLADTVLRYANDNLSMSNGYFYEKKLMGDFGVLEESFGSMTEIKQKPSTITLRLFNKEGDLDRVKERHTLGNRRVDVLIGEGHDYSQHTVVFQGIIRFPGGVRLNDTRMELTVDDIRSKDVVSLPPKRFSSADYPNLDPTIEGKAIPICYGDWTYGTQEVVAQCIDTAAVRMKICDHAIKSLGTVKRNGTAVTPSNIDLTKGEFGIPAWASGDKITTQCQGKVDASDNLIDTYKGVMEDLLLGYIGKAASDLDSAAFDAVDAETSSWKLRRFINSDISSDMLIEEMGNEVKVHLTVRGGRYYPILYLPTTADIQAADPFNENDVLKASFDTVEDPDALYANRLVGLYLFNPAAERTGESDFEGISVVENQGAQQEMGQVVERKIFFKWLHQAEDVNSSLNIELFTNGNIVEQMECELGFRALFKSLGQVIKLTFSRFSEMPFKIIELVKYFSPGDDRGIVRVLGVNVNNLAGAGHWADDSATFPDYLGGGDASVWDKNWTDAQKDYARRNFGYWLDDNKYADPADPASKNISKWAA